MVIVVAPRHTPGEFTVVVRPVLFGVALLAACAAACAADPAPGLAEPAALTLYSLDGKRQAGKGELPPGAETFHGYLVLGQVKLSDAQARGEVVAALRRAIRAGGQMNKCFWPRHGVRSVEGGTTIDYVVCFECAQAEVYRDGGRAVIPLTAGGAGGVLDAVLKRAGVELAPAEH